MDTKIGVSTESWPWRRKFSHCSSRDLNPRPFDLESGALTTELSPLPNIWHDLLSWLGIKNQLFTYVLSRREAFTNRSFSWCGAAWNFAPSLSGWQTLSHPGQMVLRTVPQKRRKCCRQQPQPISVHTRIFYISLLMLSNISRTVHCACRLSKPDPTCQHQTWDWECELWWREIWNCPETK